MNTNATNTKIYQQVPSVNSTAFPAIKRDSSHGYFI